MRRKSLPLFLEYGNGILHDDFHICLVHNVLRHDGMAVSLQRRQTFEIGGGFNVYDLFRLYKGPVFYKQ